MRPIARWKSDRVIAAWIFRSGGSPARSPRAPGSGGGPPGGASGGGRGHPTPTSRFVASCGTGTGRGGRDRDTPGPDLQALPADQQHHAPARPRMAQGAAPTTGAGRGRRPRPTRRAERGLAERRRSVIGDPQLPAGDRTVGGRRPAHRCACRRCRRPRRTARRRTPCRSGRGRARRAGRSSSAVARRCCAPRPRSL